MTERKINWQPDHLEDGRVRLLPLEEDHFKTLYQVASDPLIWEQHPASNRYEKNVFRDFFDGGLSTGSAFVIEDRSSGRIIGSTRYYDYDESNNCIAIGYTFLQRAYWGGQYNRSVKMLMLNYAFQFVVKVIFHIGATNIRSQLATARFGARKTGEFKKGESLNYEYTLMRDEWKP